MTWKVPLSEPDIGEEEIAAVTAVLRGGWLTMGPVTRQFEADFAAHVGVANAFAVSNATVALHLAFHALGIGPGDEVIVPSLTFVATANAVLYTGARPVFADITSRDDLCVSPVDIERRITPRTRAIAVMHYGGYPCDMDAIREIARVRGLSVVEDAAHAPGAELGGRRCGALGDIGCFSFFSNKNLATGEGGMIVTDCPEIAERLPRLRSHGMTTLTWDRHRGHAFSYDVTGLGFNYRIDELRSALGIVQLRKLDPANARRRAASDRYRTALAGIDELSIPFAASRGTPSGHLFPVLARSPELRDRIMAELAGRGVQTSIHYPPVHLFSYYRQSLDTGPGLLPLTEEVAGRLLTLPLHARLHDSDIDIVCEALAEAATRQD